MTSNLSKPSPKEISARESSLPQGAPPYWEEAKASLSCTDPTLGEVIRRFATDPEDHDPPLTSRGDLFYTLANAIVGQQISAAAADAVWSRLLNRLGGVDPSKVREASPEDLRSVGLSGRKVEYLQGVARSFPQLLTFPWSEMTDQEVIKALTTLRGIGPWTAEMVLIFTLLRPDVLPLGDIGVIRAVERLYHHGEKLSKSEVELIAERWRPYRTVAVWYLWRTIDAEPVRY